MNLNPYAQAGWGGSSGGNGPAPSIFGALPFSSQSTGPSTHKFQFTAFNPDILDCTVLGPSSNTYFRVLNNTPSQNFTLFQNREGKSIAVLEWRGSSGVVVEVRDIIRKQFVASWLQLSTDGKYRFMNAHDRTFVWVPQDEYVGLYTYGTTTPELYARLSRADGGVTLEITSTAIRESLLECCVVATVLLQSGRSID
ncbi:hypothetical protein F5051DRAFT_160205 [Lentinula edodes]|uniref:DUF6593 domain-containing protein n=1 Tax=Lentinula lateritia TaxID=40482 RepID=A0A9W9A082_9AGAR|nr:hypothetical protein F5051DRAFT_160205 [Lentinula edodes]KAJ4470648.1 hypothetical protein C8J55DRAFT_491734 [Lentinula edodes]